MPESNFQEQMPTSDSDILRLPISQHIDLPKELELLATPDESQHGLAYVDRENMKVYRVMDLTRHGEGNEENEIEDYWQKLATSMDDKVGLTPKIYRFDPKNYIIEMEFIDGKRLDKVPRNDLSLASVRRFWRELNKWHEQKLYHGDLFSGKNYILEPSGRIRIIDPTYEIDLGTVHTSVEGIQKKDNEQVLDIFQRHFGYSKANITGNLIEQKQAKEGAEIKSDLSEQVVKAIDTNDIAYVYQRGIGVSGGDDKSKRFIETSDFGSESPGFGSCVTVVCRDVLSGKTALLHIDTLTDIPKARELIEQNLQAEHISISVVGGESGISEPIIAEINSHFSQIKGVKLTNVDILGERGRSRRQVVVDTKTGDLYILYSEARRNLKTLSELIRIKRDGRMNIITGSNNKSLIIDALNPSLDINDPLGDIELHREGNKVLPATTNENPITIEDIDTPTTHVLDPVKRQENIKAMYNFLDSVELSEYPISSLLPFLHEKALNGWNLRRTGRYSISGEIGKKTMSLAEPGQYRDDAGFGYTGMEMSGYRFIAPNSNDIAELVEALSKTYETLLNDPIAAEHPKLLAAWSMIQMSLIHPFYEGNGRISRAILPYTLKRLGQTPIFLENYHSKPFEGELNEIATEIVGKLYQIGDIYPEKNKEGGTAVLQYASTLEPSRDNVNTYQKKLKSAMSTYINTTSWNSLLSDPNIQHAEQLLERLAESPHFDSSESEDHSYTQAIDVLKNWGVAGETIEALEHQMEVHEFDYTNLELRARVIGQASKFVDKNGLIYIRGGYNAMGGYPAGECSDISNSLFFELNYLGISDELQKHGIAVLYCNGHDPVFFEDDKLNHVFLSLYKGDPDLPLDDESIVLYDPAMQVFKPFKQTQYRISEKTTNPPDKLADVAIHAVDSEQKPSQKDTFLIGLTRSRDYSVSMYLQKVNGKLNGALNIGNRDGDIGFMRLSRKGVAQTNIKSIFPGMSKEDIDQILNVFMSLQNLQFQEIKDQGVIEDIQGNKYFTNYDTDGATINSRQTKRI